jgi:hypothetical protein
MHDFYFCDENKTNVKGFNFGNDMARGNDPVYSYCSRFGYIADHQIEKVEFVDGFVKFGDFEIILNAERMTLTGDLYLNERWIDVRQIKKINGVWEIGKLVLDENESDSLKFKYQFHIREYIHNDVVKNIFDEYKKYKKRTNVHLKYNILMDSEIKTIEKRMYLSIETEYFNIFDYL